MKNFNNFKEMLLKCPFKDGIFILSRDEDYVTVYNSHTDRVSKKNIKKNSKGEFFNINTPTLGSYRSSGRRFLTEFNTVYTLPKIGVDKFVDENDHRTFEYLFDDKSSDIYMIVQAKSYPWKEYGNFRSFRCESDTIGIINGIKYVMTNPKFIHLESCNDIARYKVEYDFLIEIK